MRPAAALTVSRPSRQCEKPNNREEMTMRLFLAAALLLGAALGSTQAQAQGACTMQDQSGCHSCTDWVTLCSNNCNANSRCQPDCQLKFQLCRTSGTWTDRTGREQPGVLKNNPSPCVSRLRSIGKAALRLRRNKLRLAGRLM
jgi:hypothetical protein